MVLCGCDPSFQRTGLAVFKENKIYIRNCRSEPNADKSFQAVWKGAEEQSDRIIQELRKISDRYDVILSECPPPQGQFSPGLYALDSLLFDKYKAIAQSVRVVYPNYVGHVHGKKKYNKSESVELARVLLQRLEKFVTVDTVSKRISHDESEAIIFLCRLFVLNNVFVEELKDFTGLFSDKDKLLY